MWSRGRSGAAVASLLGAVGLALLPSARVPVDVNGLYVDFLREELRAWGIAPDVLVIREQTGVFPEDVADPARWTRLHEQLPTLRREVFDDFVSRNRTPVTLTLTHVGSTPVRLFPRDEAARYFHAGADDGWERFWAAYPRSQGIAMLSAVGRSRDGRQALLYHGNSASGTGGGGSCYLLARKNGGWTIVGESFCWQA